MACHLVALRPGLGSQAPGDDVPAGAGPGARRKQQVAEPRLRVAGRASQGAGSTGVLGFGAGSAAPVASPAVLSLGCDPGPASQPLWAELTPGSGDHIAPTSEVQGGRKLRVLRALPCAQPAVRFRGTLRS